MVKCTYLPNGTISYDLININVNHHCTNYYIQSISYYKHVIGIIYLEEEVV